MTLLYSRTYGWLVLQTFVILCYKLYTFKERHVAVNSTAISYSDCAVFKRNRGRYFLPEVLDGLPSNRLVPLKRISPSKSVECFINYPTARGYATRSVVKRTKDAPVLGFSQRCIMGYDAVSLGKFFFSVVSKEGRLYFAQRLRVTI